MRIQNDGAGKSSWWMINPEAKPGKGARRRANSMEQTKSAMERKAKNKLRNGKKDQQMPASLPGGTHHLLEHTPSPCSSVSENIDQIPESPAGQMLQNPAQVQLNPNQLHAHHTQSSQNGGSPVYHQLSSLQPQQPPAGQPPMYAQANSAAAQLNNNLNNSCLLGQMSSPDHQQSFRARTTSNASSCGRFSPLDDQHQQHTGPLNWPQMNQTSQANYQQLEQQCPNEMLNFSNLSINGGNMNDPHQQGLSAIQHQQQQQQQQQNSNYTNDNYMANNMYIGNSAMYSEDPRGYRKLNNGAVCKTTPPQNSISNSINNSMNNLNSLNQQAVNQINNHQPINCSDSLLLNCDNNNMSQMDGSLLNTTNDNFDLMPGGNQSIDSYFAQTDYPLNSGSQLLSDTLNCDSNNQPMLGGESTNDDENNNRIFALTQMSSGTSQAPQSHQPTSYHQSNRYEPRFNGEWCTISTISPTINPSINPTINPTLQNGYGQYNLTQFY